MKKVFSDDAAPMSEATGDEYAFHESAPVRVEQLSKEAGWLLITAGVVGLVVPGVLGTPFLLAGAVVLVPGGSTLPVALGRPFRDAADRSLSRRPGAALPASLTP
jgi:hypothetical protein